MPRLPVYFQDLPPAGHGVHYASARAHGACLGHPWKFIMQTPHRQLLISVAMLLLHASIWVGPSSPWHYPMMLVHAGLILLWQPAWQGQRLERGKGILLLGLVCLLVYALNWWLLTAWVLLLTGLVGSCVSLERDQRHVYTLVLVVLFLELLLGCLPPLFAMPLHTTSMQLLHYGMIVVLLIIPLLPMRDDPRRVVVDPLRGTALALLALVLGIGSLLGTFYTSREYLVVMAGNLLAVGGLLLMMSWLLSPRSGLHGLTLVWAQHLLRLAPSMERWLTDLNALTQQTETPEDFLKVALATLTELPWVRGVNWSVAAETGRHGTCQGQEVRIFAGDLVVSLFVRQPAPTPVLLHCRLCVQLCEHFYAIKLRERELACQAQLQAVHETGARLTHDIKNLLQSLQVLLGVWRQQGERADPALRAATQRQLEQTYSRLKLALDKLGAPAAPQSQDWEPLATWWQRLRERHATEAVEFDAGPGTPTGVVPTELFDSIADNLLENARCKQQREQGLAVRVTLAAENGEISLSISDNGKPLHGQLARRVLREPVHSDYGLGVGLYQAARQAEHGGYSLALKHNRADGVCFQLQGPLWQQPPSARTQAKT